VTDEPRPRRIEIPEELAASAGVPDDLQSDVLDPYAVPDVARRRRAGLVYVAAALVTAIGIGLGLPAGMWGLVAAFVLIAGYHHLAGWRLAVRENAALEIANRVTDFPVGHASAVVGFVGWRSRPVWNVLVFSADDPPSQRGLVRVDGVDGHVLDSYVEPVPDAAPDR
jgi:hypothetical protein